MSKGEITGPRLNNLWAWALSVVEVLRIKNPRYGDSWKSHGGFSAFFNTQRKWSRVEHLASQHGFDVFKAIEATRGQPDSMEEALRDLLGYGLLILEDQGQCSDTAARMLTLRLHERCDGNHPPPTCNDPQCWLGEVADQ